jgi:hypothetical protein
MLRNLFLALCLALPAAVCWERHAESNDERAYFVRDGHSYRVKITGRRFPLVHDPISLLLERTYEETFALELPRIEGAIEGSEIPVSPDKLRYTGRVVITDGKMNVDLYYDDDERPRRPLPWNGEYTLVPQR